VGTCSGLLFVFTSLGGFARFPSSIRGGKEVGGYIGDVPKKRLKRAFLGGREGGKGR